MGLSHRELIEQVSSIVRSRLAEQGAGHGYDHIQRVWKTACHLQGICGGNLLVIELAALLHDIGDAKFHHGKECSKKFSVEILNDLGADEVTVNHVAQIVDNISFRKRASAEVLSLEGQVVQDADRLDALGAIGIVRTIEFGVAFDQPFYDAEPARHNAEQKKTGVGHFHEKLFKLRNLMNTDAGREMAKTREDFMRSFLAQFELECTGQG